MNELQEILARLNKLTPEEQAEVEKYIQQQEFVRQENRKKELWGNVMGAIRKYESEIGVVSVYCESCGTSYCIDESQIEPGFITIN